MCIEVDGTVCFAHFAPMFEFTLLYTNSAIQWQKGLLGFGAPIYFFLLNELFYNSSY